MIQKLKIRKVYEFNSALGISGDIKGLKLAKSINENIEKTKPVIENFEKNILETEKIFKENSDWKEYVKKAQAIHKKFETKKDEKSLKKLESEIEKLNKENPEAVKLRDEFNEKAKAFEKSKDEVEAEIEFTMINFNDLPDTMSGADLSNLNFMINS